MQRRGAQMPATSESFREEGRTSSCPGSQSSQIGILRVIDRQSQGNNAEGASEQNPENLNKSLNICR